VPVNKRFASRSPATPSINTATRTSPRTLGAGRLGHHGRRDPTNGLPDTTPGNPYLSDFTIRDSTRDNRTDSVGATLDFKLTPTTRSRFVSMDVDRRAAQSRTLSFS